MSEIIERSDLDSSDPVEAAPADREREAARKRVEQKHKFRGDVVAYAVINLFLIGLWAATGFGYFWPGWVLAGWGVLLLLDAWNVYHRRPITEAEIDEELRAGRG
jgi:fatty acid desaturase